MQYDPSSVDLFSVISTGGGLGESGARPVFAQLARAVAEVHARGYAHRDIKPENVLYS